MKDRTRRQLALGASFAAYFVALWYLWYTPLVYPLKIFVVLLHEVSHAIAMIATGGSVDRITLNAQQGGAMWGYGGNRFITLSAGYLGSLVLGGMMMLGAQSKRIRSQWLLGFVGVTVLVLTAVYIEGGFGVGFGVLFGLALLAMSQKLDDVWSGRILTALGLTSIGYAIFDIKSDVLDRPELRSDAAMLAELTGIPTLFWGVLWIGLAIAAAFFLLRRAVRNV